jgi:hypothetical protein
MKPYYHSRIVTTHRLCNLITLSGNKVAGIGRMLFSTEVRGRDGARPVIARNEAIQTNNVLDCFTAFAMTPPRQSRRDVIARHEAIQKHSMLDCFGQALAMTKRKSRRDDTWIRDWRSIDVTETGKQVPSLRDLRCHVIGNAVRNPERLDAVNLTCSVMLPYPHKTL